MSTADMLRARGIQPSWQRIRIYETLAATRCHPSVDSIHSTLVTEIPTLSRTTVYATLDLFAHNGLARRLTVSETEFRFDADTSPHAHCRCASCGEVADIPHSAPPLSLSLPVGWTCSAVHLYAEGLCPACASPVSF